jgi:hypothetical protein
MDTCTSGAQLFISSSRGLEQEGKKNKTKKRNTRESVGEHSSSLFRITHTQTDSIFTKIPGSLYPAISKRRRRKVRGLLHRIWFVTKRTGPPSPKSNKPPTLGAGSYRLIESTTMTPWRPKKNSQTKFFIIIHQRKKEK